MKRSNRFQIHRFNDSLTRGQSCGNALRTSRRRVVTWLIVGLSSVLAMSAMVALTNANRVQANDPVASASLTINPGVKQVAWAMPNAGREAMSGTRLPGRQSDDYLRRSKFPWYDSQRDEVVPIPLEPGPSAASRSRDKIPIATSQPQAVNRPATSTRSWWLDAIFYAGIGLLVATVLGLIIWFLMTRKDRDEDEWEAEVGGSIDVSRIAELPFAISGNPADFRALAARAAQEGNFAKATIYLFSHLLLILDKNQWVRLRKGRTNRQYLWELSHRSPLRSYFEAAMIPFEQAFFGAKTIEAAVFTQLWSQLPEMETLISQKENEAQHVL